MVEPTISLLRAQRDALLAVCTHLLNNAGKGTDNYWRLGPFADPSEEAGKGGTIEMLREAVALCRTFAPVDPTKPRDEEDLVNELRPLVQHVLLVLLVLKDRLRGLSYPSAGALEDTVSTIMADLAVFDRSALAPLISAYDLPDPPAAYGFR